MCPVAHPYFKPKTLSPAEQEQKSGYFLEAENEKILDPKMLIMQFTGIFVPTHISNPPSMELQVQYDQNIIAAVGETLVGR